MGATSVLITGASSGIGRAAALEWARRKARVALSARSHEQLAEVAREVTAAGGDALVVPGDVTREEDRVALVESASAAFGGIDVLVNNAGRGYYSAFRDIDAAELEALFALNVVAPVRLTQLALPALERSRGVVVMVSSLAGVVSAPRLGAYAASKFALEALASGLRAEVAASGVRVVVVRPGPVDTAFRANSITHGGEAGVRPRGAKAQTPEDVGALVVRAAERGTPVVETSLYVHAVSFVARHTPAILRWATARMAAHGE
jgi:short-subunit dehydrogenase